MNTIQSSIQNRKLWLLMLVLAMSVVNGQSAAPTITMQPWNQIARQGDTAWYAVAASGTAPLSYQWRSNGVAIAGATSTNYTTPVVVNGMNGTVYSVVVSNSSGTITSTNTTLRVLAPLGRELVWNDEFNGTTIDTSKWIQQGDISRQQGFWWKANSYLNGNGQLVLAVTHSTGTNYGSGAVQSVFQRAFGYWEAKMKFQTQQGHWDAFWLMDNAEGSTNVIGGTDGAEIDILEHPWILIDQAQNTLHWDGYSPNDPLAGSAANEVTNMGVQDGGWHIVGLDWTPTNYNYYLDGVLTWSTNAGGVCQVSNFCYCSDEIGNFGTGANQWGTGSITNATLPDYTYFEYVRVYETNLNGAPYITTQPQSQATYQGSSATFSVTAAGTGTLNYQWQFNGINISGATATNYTSTSVQPANAGNYSVVVTNTLGLIASANATLTVLGTNIPPAITLQPQSHTVIQGSNVLFTVAASGTKTMGYQWKFNGASISGASGTSTNYNMTAGYILANAQPSNAGNYSVVITNGFGSVTSSIVNLVVSGGVQTLWLDFNTAGQFTTNFSNPPYNTNSPCTETNAGGVTNSGAVLVTGGDGNATYTNAVWDFSVYTGAWVNVSAMIKIQQSPTTSGKIQLGIASYGAGFAATTNGQAFGSYRLLPQSATSPSYQLDLQERDGTNNFDFDVGSPFTLTAGHWYQFNTYFTNTSPGVSYNIACSLIDYGTNGATAGTNMILVSTLEPINGSYGAVLSSLNTVSPCLRVGTNTGAALFDNFSINGGGNSGNTNGAQALWLNFNTTGQYNTNFSNPGTGGSPCTETNVSGVTNSGALLVTALDANATYTNASWNFSTNNAAISVSMMIKIKQATSTGGKIQLGLVNSNSAGFAGAASGDGWNFGSFRLLPQSTSALTYQLGYQTATNGTTSSGNVGSVITLTAGHWYQFATYFTNTSHGVSYNLACSLIDYGTNGATAGTNMFTFSTLETATATQAVLSSDVSVWPSFRVGNNTGASVLDDLGVNIGSTTNMPMLLITPPATGQTAPPQFGAPALSNGRLTLTWGGTSPKTAQGGTVILLTANSVAGPWTVVTNAASPYTVSIDPNATQIFFKLKQ